MQNCGNSAIFSHSGEFMIKAKKRNVQLSLINYEAMTVYLAFNSGLKKVNVNQH